jgi:cyanate lyase
MESTSEAAAPRLPEVTQEILRAKAAKGLTFAELAASVGCNPVFLAAVCYRQASATREQAEKLLHALGLGVDLLPELTSFPVKGGLMPTVPVERMLLTQAPWRNRVCAE